MPALELQFYPHQDYIKRADNFTKRYDLVDVIIHGNGRYSRKELKPKSERICRFCGLKMPEVRFSDDAHLLSEMIGNKEMFSDFECNTCNKKFSLYENELANFLGISRTILGVKTKGGVPNYKSAGKILSAKHKSFFGNDIIIIAREDAENSMVKSLDAKAGRIELRYVKNPYSPLKVYKAFLKWALSIFNDQEIKDNYSNALDCLNGKGIMKGCIISGYKLPFQVNFEPRIFLFKKKKAKDKIHTHLAVFYFQNDIISLPIPLHKSDMLFYDGKELIEPPLYPPLFTQFEDSTNLPLFEIMYDLSAEDKVKNAEERITVQMNQEQLKKSTAYNSETDTYHEKEFHPAPIKYMILTKDGVTVDPKELVRFIKEEMEKSTTSPN